jgi:hypothetical protein
MSVGRPSSYTDDIAFEICDRIAEGESLKRICASEGMPGQGTVFRWLANPENAVFRESYARAREAQADALFDETLDISDDGSNDWMLRNHGDDPEESGWKVNGEHIQRSRLRVDTRKWMAGKLAPKKYGDKSAVEVSGKDGGPIETKELSSLEMARRIGFLLEKGKREVKD